MNKVRNHSENTLANVSYSSCDLRLKKTNMNIAPFSVDPQKFLRIPLVPVNCSFGVVTEHTEDIIELKSTIQKEHRRQKADVTIVFAIRRVGCKTCREHALQLLSLEEEDKKLSLIGIVKDTKNNDGLLNFYNNYFRRPIYKDKKWSIINYMNNRKKNPLTIVKKHLFTIRNRKEDNAYCTNELGKGDEMWTQGGVLIFDKNYELQYIFNQTNEKSLDLNLIRKAIKNARNLT